MSTRVHEGYVSIDILVQPRASRAQFGPTHGDRIKVFVTSPPVDGEANDAVVELLRKTFAVAKGKVSITSGLSSRRKTVRVEGITGAHIEEAMQ
jgi:uncharacterized protein (TIGR00251 family)